MTAAIVRAPRPCLHKQADHQHGTYACHMLDRCRCLPCCYARSVYDLARRKRNAYGRSDLVDAGPVREHVAALMAAGVGLKRIVAVSGVAQGTLWKLMYGKNGGTPSKRVTRVTADRLLALDPTAPALLADGAVITSPGAARRLQALTCLGWSIGRLSGEGDLGRQRLDAAINGQPVVVGTVRAVAALYERLWDQPAPANNHRERISVTRSIDRAKAAGWVPPLAWDDDTIDDPNAQPHTGDGEDQVDEYALDAVLEGVRLHLDGKTLHAAVHALADAGHQPTAIAERLGISDQQAYRLRGRAAIQSPAGSRVTITGRRAARTT